MNVNELITALQDLRDYDPDLQVIAAGEGFVKALSVGMDTGEVVLLVEEVEGGQTGIEVHEGTGDQEHGEVPGGNLVGETPSVGDPVHPEVGSGGGDEPPSDSGAH